MMPNMMNFGGYGQIPQQGASLSMVDQNQLIALSQQGNASLTHEQLLEMQSAQQNELMMNQAITGAVANAAQQDIQETGGQNVQAAMQQAQGV